MFKKNGVDRIAPKKNKTSASHKTFVDSIVADAIIGYKPENKAPVRQAVIKYNETEKDI